MQMLTNRTRFNSGDSNTSGVSSCDSANMRTVVSELLHQTLSPIPSTSNLMDMKKSSTDERFRRVSLTGTPIRDISQLSDQDLHGYKKLRQIRRNLRPMLSESAADDLADIYENENVNLRSGKILTSFQNEPKRKLQVRSLDRQYSLNLSG